MAEKENKSKAKRIISVIFTAISAVIFVFVALLLINMIVCRSQNRPVNFFGYSFSVVQTDSMEPDIMTGDLIVFKKVDFSTIDVDDVIVFKADESFGEKLEGYTIVHKVVEKTEEGLVTWGVNNVTGNDTPLYDNGFRTEDEVYGICISNSAAWGKIFSFLSQYGVIIIIFLVAVPVIVTQTIKIVKYSKEKKAEGEAQGDGNSSGENSGGNMEDNKPAEDNKATEDNKPADE